MAVKVIRALNGAVIPLSVIDNIRILSEECTGDGEFDKIHHWQLVVRTSMLYGNSTHVVFEAKNFDNPNQWFYSIQAVKGSNYDIVKAKHDKLKGILDKERLEQDYILL